MILNGKRSSVPNCVALRVLEVVNEPNIGEHLALLEKGSAEKHCFLLDRKMTSRILAQKNDSFVHYKATSAKGGAIACKSPACFQIAAKNLKLEFYFSASGLVV